MWRIVEDFRYALRTLAKSPGFAATAICTLALGIGASTAVFTVIDSVVLQPLSYRDSGRLVAVWELLRSMSPDPVGPNPRHASLWQTRSLAFTGMAMLTPGASGLSLGSEHPRLTGTIVCTTNLLDLLQVKPLLGRGFLAEEGVEGHDNVAILTYPLWQSLFQGDPHAIGRTIRLADIPREVIGVLPADFHFPNKNALGAFRTRQTTSSAPEPAVFLPSTLDPSTVDWNSEYGNWVVLGRLRVGITPGQAEAQLNAVQAEVAREMPAALRGNRLPATIVQPMREAMVGGSRNGLWLLMTAVIGLMSIACLNLANAQLGRTLSRHREGAIRAALGASVWRLVWVSLAENLLLAVLGGVAGVALAAAGLQAFRAYSPVDLPRLSEVQLNPAVLLFSTALTLGASILFGMAPALRLAGADPQAVLQQSNGRSLGGRQSQRLRTWLIGAQVFGCTVLLLLTGLFSKSLLNLLHQDKGFDTGHVTVAEARLPAKTYPAAENRIAFDDAVLRNLREIPGVVSAGMVSAMPLEGESWIEPLARLDRPDQQTPPINLRWVSPGYFESMRERLVAGRWFEERDRDLQNVVLSEGEAKSLWAANESPLGAQVQLQGKPHIVIGVVADSRNTSLKAVPVKMAYLHYKERPPYSCFFLVRGLQSADAVISNTRQAIWKYAPDLTIARVKTLDAQLQDSLATERFQTVVLISFGAAALLLAMLGIYGVLSYSIATRKQEIGLRMALGATRPAIYALTVREVGTPVLGGLAAGVAASILAGGAIQKLLYGIQPVDPAIILAVALLFPAAAVAAAFLPARRAASVDPMEALRSE